MAPNPSSNSCTLNIRYLLIGCDCVTSHNSLTFSVRDKLLVAGAVASCLVRTRCMSTAFCLHEWERERGRESNTSDSNLFGARSASGSNAPLCMPGICAATQNVSTQKRALTGHSGKLSQPLSPCPYRKKETERATLVRASGVQTQHLSPQLFIMETNSEETAPTRHTPAIKHKELSTKTNCWEFFISLRRSMQIMYMFYDDPSTLCRQVSVVRRH